MGTNIEQTEAGKYTARVRLTCAGLLGISLVIVQAFIPVGFTNVASDISMLAFAVTIPTLAIRILIGETPKYQGNDKKLLLVASVMFNIGLNVAFLGVIAAFWYIQWIVGVVFLISAIAGSIVYFGIARTSR